MERPDELTPEQEAILKAEESIMDDMLGSLDLICGETDAQEYLAQLMEIALYGKQDTKLAKIEEKCLRWHDLMAHKIAGV